MKARSDGGDATTAALNASRAFFEKGAPPPRGLDPLDLFLLRKGNLMSECGESDSFVITAAGPSDALDVRHACVAGERDGGQGARGRRRGSSLEREPIGERIGDGTFILLHSRTGN